MNTFYSSSFYDGQSTQSLTSARVILGTLFTSFQPTSVVDVGCGVGPWLRAAQELGVTDILGLDGDYIDPSALMIDQSAFIAIDLETQRVRNISGLNDGRRFDLVISVEVAEHLSFSRAASFVEDLTSLGDMILFSAAVPFQGGEHHVNEQWPEFWALLFRAHEYECLDTIRPLVWGRDDVEWWYAQNVLLFYRKGSQVASRFQPRAFPAHAGLALVHPNNYLEQILKWFHVYRFAAADEEIVDLRALLNAYQDGGTELPLLRAIARAAADPDRADVFPNTRIQRSIPEVLARESHSREVSLQQELESQAAKMAAFRIEQEKLLLSIQNLFSNTLSETQRRMDELENSRSETQRRLDELENSRGVRLLRHYYCLYSHPWLGPPFRLARRSAGWIMRRLPRRTKR